VFFRFIDATSVETATFRQYSSDGKFDGWSKQFVYQCSSGRWCRFELYLNQPFAKKLIIGAILNGTPGHGICYFDILIGGILLVQAISYESVLLHQLPMEYRIWMRILLEWKEDGFHKRVKTGATSFSSWFSWKNTSRNKLTKSVWYHHFRKIKFYY